MNSIILYPENDRYVLKRIFKSFNSRNIETDASRINRKWTITQLNALYGVLDGYTHIFVILSSENFNDCWFVGLLGYLKGSNKGNFFYFTENNGSLDRMFSNFNTGEGYDSVDKFAETESIRWNQIQLKDQARTHLIESGFALTKDAMGESVASGQIDIIQNYINAGFSSSSRNSKGVPMLCIAIRNSHIDVVRHLINSGADINAVSEDRHNTPLMDAAASGFIESIKILVKEGSDLECQSKNGQTALILAVGNGDEEISNYLLSVGADYEVKDALGMSAKGYATLFNKKDILINMI